MRGVSRVAVEPGQAAVRTVGPVVAVAIVVVVGSLGAASVLRAPFADLSPTTWQAEYDRYLAAQLVDRTNAGVATGSGGAVTVAYNGLAARAGLEALIQGGNAMDAALTAGLAQVALTAGAPVSYFGIMSLVYYDAATGRVHTMNAEWNTVLGETSPRSIPGGISMATERGMLGTAVSGRTALVGGFMKGVGAAHDRFGRLPFAEIFKPAIHVAEHGFTISRRMSGYWRMRADDLARLPETAETFLKPDGAPYVEGDVFRQPVLAATLARVAEEGVGYMYGGPWAERAVAAIRADGGHMTVEDLARYEVVWADPLVADIGEYRIHTNPPPNEGGVTLIEAQRLALASGLVEDGHWSESAEALRKALDIAYMSVVDYLPAQAVGNTYPGIDFSPESRVTEAHARALWERMESGTRLANWASPGPRHSDDVVAIDGEGNIAAITHSINAVIWGKTAIVVDGITIGDPASFQQGQVAAAGPGERLESPTETGIVFHHGEPWMGFASMGAGLHYRTFQGLLNVMQYGMAVDEAVDAPDFFAPHTSPTTFQLTVRVPGGRFPHEVLDGTGYAWDELSPDDARFGGEGIWIAVTRDPRTGELRAASHNRNNSAAVAY
ncbi:MAG: gamma-glutamyltransferase [Gemmatimonadota bacterium]|nr:gamma-glutamyltransferase [Gemmatimonadota bacterium]